MCGGWNHTSSFTATLPNPETPQLLTPLHSQGMLLHTLSICLTTTQFIKKPLILSLFPTTLHHHKLFHVQGACNCDRNNYYYDLWFPCGVDHADGKQVTPLSLLLTHTYNTLYSSTHLFTHTESNLSQLLEEETCDDTEDIGDGRGLTALRTVSDSEVRSQR